jgi:Domain of unknown function (DUF4386)
MHAPTPSPAACARLGGLIYLAIIGLGLFGEAFVRGSLVLSGDAAGTAANIQASPGLWRAGIAGDLLMHVLDVPLIVILYLLLRPVSRSLALLATLLNVVQTSVLVANKLTLVVPVLLLLSNPAYLSGLPRQELNALSYLSIQLHGYGFGVGLIFFGVACLVRGHLIVRSGYFPKALGVLLGVAGIGYLVNSAALLLAPSLASAMFPAVLLPAFVGELALCLWLIVKGVDATAWQQSLVANRQQNVRSDA